MGEDLVCPSSTHLPHPLEPSRTSPWTKVPWDKMNCEGPRSQMGTVSQVFVYFMASLGLALNSRHSPEDK